MILLMVGHSLVHRLVQIYEPHTPQVTRINVSGFISHVQWDDMTESELLRN